MNKLALILTFVSLNLFAQESPQIIEATTDKNVFLFFPSPIEKALSGNGDFQFGYNTQTAEKFGVLKAVAPKGESTLHVITEDQTVYSFIVKYAKDITKFEYFFNGSESVGNINGKTTNENKGQDLDVQIIPEPGDPIHFTSSVNVIDSGKGRKITEQDYYGSKAKNLDGDLEFCNTLVQQGEYYKNLYRTKSNIVLKLTNIAYKDDKTFMVITIENKSTVDYDLNFIQFNKIAKKASKKSNYQAIEIENLKDSTFQPFGRIEAFGSHTAVYVFHKLSIDKNKLINIEINELQGERNLQLPVGHKLINNPNSNK